MEEIERRFLVNELPEDIESSNWIIVEDKIVEDKSGFPHIRIRRIGNTYEINKKYPKDESDVSQMIEESILITKSEYDSLVQVPGFYIGKTRYFYPNGNFIVEINVYMGALEGLIIAEVEFESVEEMYSYQKPKFLGAEVTQMNEFATGSLMHKKFEDLKELIDGLKE